MDPQPESQSKSISLFGSGDRRNLSTMSISELISELRDTFMKSVFNRVEETLVSREATLKAEIEEKNFVIGLLQEKIQFERLEKIRVESELKKVTGDKVVESEFGGGRNKIEVLKNKGVDNGAVVKVEGEKVRVLGENKRLNCEPCKENCLGSSDTDLVHERCKPVVFKNKGVVNGNATVVAELEGEKAEVLVEKKGLVGELIKKGGVGSSGGRFGIGTLIDLEDSDEDECNSQASNTKHTTSRVNVNNDRKISLGAHQTNLATRQVGVGPIGIHKRRFASPSELVTNINNILDGLDDVSSSSSSSSSSSGELDMDIPFRSLTSNKKMRTGAYL